VGTGKRPLPTKIELIRIKRSLEVARSVYKILEDKRDVLLKRLEDLIQEASDSREKMWKPLSEAYRALYNAYLTLGPLTLESIASTTPIQLEVEVNVKSIVDVKVPSLSVSGKDVGLTYGFGGTNSALDSTTMMIRKVLPDICKAAEAENAIFSLARELERTQRLINALEYIIIPTYEESANYIRATLEEREREDFVRLKHVKAILEARKE
jgi:V/A-type H+-transporting ATPase subunit D